MAKVILAIALIAFITLIVLYGICTVQNGEFIRMKPIVFSAKDTLNKNAQLNELEFKNVSLEDKITFTNKRFDDLYVLGGTIIVLLIAMVAFIYVKTENEVKAYMEEHFEKYEDEIQKHLKNAAAASAEIIAKNTGRLAAPPSQEKTPTN